MEVAELAVQRHGDDLGEGVRGDHPGDAGEAAEVVGDRREGGGDDGAVEGAEDHGQLQPDEDDDRLPGDLRLRLVDRRRCHAVGHRTAAARASAPAERRPQRRRVGEVHGAEAEGGGPGHVLGPVVDERRLGGVEPVAVDQQPVDRRVGLHHALPARVDDALEQRHPLEPVEHVQHVGRHVREHEQPEPVGVQLTEELGGAGDLAGDHVVVPVVPEADRRVVLGVQGDQLRDRLGHRAAAVVLGVPRPRAHLGEEPLHLVLVGQHLPVQVARVPVDQDAAEVEDDGLQAAIHSSTTRSSIPRGSAPWRRTSSWKPRRSNRSPIAAVARCPQLLDLERPDLVGEGLAGPDDVAVDLDDQVVLGRRRVLDEEVDGLLPGPAEGVHAGVEDEPARPHQLGVERAVALVRVLVEPELVAEALAVEAPALDVRGAGEALAAEVRQALGLLRERDLEVVARAPPRGGRSTPCSSGAGTAGRRCWRRTCRRGPSSSEPGM